MPLPAHLEPLCAAFTCGLDAVLGDKLHAVYLYGAIAFPRPTPVATSTITSSSASP